MVSNEIAVVRWGRLNSETALYGTALTLQTSGDVRLVNPLMPSGAPIQEWYSFTDYQSVREAPTLPLLHSGQRYRIEPVIESVPADTVIFDVRYFDRFDGLVRTDVLYAPDYSFTYPTECHHYTIRLLNAGCDELRFTSFTLLEVSDDGGE